MVKCFSHFLIFYCACANGEVCVCVFSLSSRLLGATKKKKKQTGPTMSLLPLFIHFLVSSPLISLFYFIVSPLFMSAAIGIFSPFHRVDPPPIFFLLLLVQIFFFISLFVNKMAKLKTGGGGGQRINFF